MNKKIYIDFLEYLAAQKMFSTSQLSQDLFVSYFTELKKTDSLLNLELQMESHLVIHISLKNIVIGLAFWQNLYLFGIMI